MNTFRDTQGRDWRVEINVDAVKRLRSLLNVDLLGVLDDECRLLARLHDDPVLLVDVLYCVCQPQADEQGISDEQFGRSMSGDALLHGSHALMESLADFFPNARQRGAFRNLLEKTRTMVERLLDYAESEIHGIDPASAAESAIASFGNLPGSSASIPDR